MKSDPYLTSDTKINTKLKTQIKDLVRAETVKKFQR